ncbi:uncharacterized protein E0L32_006706 [Thyridium curvatum]|uniref:ADP-ribosylhydrolase ARH3 n=1 Tax=Thyridium curvatum TaxID=1093900 RepID=A0A507B1B0_9PEZI|nr:uncharacterized protein E0L32_006706 [Thyridium curvatum]TPX12826.1 hypothetical protein E0L32_006706 [Thyridium curvatum]
MASPPTRLQRTVGALLGVHAGDSLGASLEFSTWDSIRKRYPTGLRDIIGGGPFSWSPGHATDDTDLTRAVLLAYLDVRRRGAAGEEEEGGDLARLAAGHMLDWMDGRWPDRTPGVEPVDFGAATRIGLDKFRASGDPAKAGAGPNQAGNGSLMRCIPTALFQDDRDKMIAESQIISAVTHDDTRCTVACAAYNVIVAALVRGESPEGAVAAGLDVAKELEKEPAKPVVVGAIRAGTRLSVQELAEKGPGASLPGKASGYVLESLSIAIAAVLDPRTLVDVLVDVVRIGKDTDTNAAIAGGLLGARDGVGAIPQDWVDKLQFRDEFTAAATELLGAEAT